MPRLPTFAALMELRLAPELARLVKQWSAQTERPAGELVGMRSRAISRSLRGLL